MRVIPYGVPQLPLTDVPAHEPVRIATAAYIDHRKGIDVLVEACSKVSSAIRLDVYGDGPDRLDLEARSKALGLHAVWHGFVPDFRARRSDYDIFVLPTRGDNLPVAILEAMAAAAPVIATRVGGIPEEVIEGKTGLLVPPDDALALAEAIDQLTSHPDLRREMGTAGRELIGTVFHPARIAREMVKFYEQQLALDKAV
jgi:glycosyltransferase involved in cell wall biosynthesis